MEHGDLNLMTSAVVVGIERGTVSLPSGCGQPGVSRGEALNSLIPRRGHVLHVGGRVGGCRRLAAATTTAIADIRLLIKVAGGRVMG